MLVLRMLIKNCCPLALSASRLVMNSRFKDTFQKVSDTDTDTFQEIVCDTFSDTLTTFV